MKDVFNNLEKIDFSSNVDFLIDTCFIAWVLEHHKEKELVEFASNKTCAITSFNAEEFIYISKKLGDNIRHQARKLFSEENNCNIKLLEINVHPGNNELEHEFVKSILPELDHEEHDTSDAVLLASAIKAKANILTRDKHDIFNTRLENFLNKYNISALNKFEN